MNHCHRAVSLPASEYKSKPINDNNNSLTLPPFSFVRVYVYRT